MRKILIFSIFLLLVFPNNISYGDTVVEKIYNSSTSEQKLDQKLHILLSKFKLPGENGYIAIDFSVYFPVSKFSDKIPNTISYISMRIPSGILEIWYTGRTKNYTFARKVKTFFENYTGYSFGPADIQVYKNGRMEITYFAKNEYPMAIEQFYNRTKNYTYSRVFDITYLEILNKTYSDTGDFGYEFFYEIDESGVVWGRIEFSKTMFDNYSDGLHTYDLLKFLNLTSLPPGEVIIEGNAMQTYTHTDFYFKSLKTNVPYTVENTTYYNITKAFEVHMDARENITQLIISFETKENYNWDDFMTDYGGYLLCGIVLLIPVAIIVVIVLHKQKKEALIEKKT